MGCDVERRVFGNCPLRRYWNAKEVRDFGRAALLDGYLRAGCQFQIQRGDRRGHIEWNLILSRQHSQRISSDLVRDIAVCSDPVGAYNDAANPSGVEEVPGHVVGDERGRNMVVLEFPDGKPRALQKRAGFSGEHVDVLAARDGRSDHAQRGSITCRGERSSVAMREHGFVIGDQRSAIAADALVNGDVFEADLLGLESIFKEETPVWLDAVASLGLTPS